MKLLVLSDLHVEFAPFDPPTTDADVVVLAGDTSPGARGVELARAWFPDVPVVYVAGNHEYYGHAMPGLTRELGEAAEAAGVRFLENRAVEIGGVRFLGCTLWTDFEILGDRSYSAAAAQASMNDYRRIRVEDVYRRFAPADARGLHLRSAEWLREALEAPFAGPTVVVTHHAPSARSLAPGFRTHPLSAAYASDLEWMMDGTRAALWVHGHTHHCVDYEVNGTRVYANQRGYPHQDTGYDPARIVEVG